MRKIVTAVSAASLALSMLAMAVPASAVSGYDSAYAGESAFVNISPGQTQSFQVFFANTGTTTWSRGTSTQVDLAACLEDKTTCNAQDATEASWNSGWLSATRYASTTQTTTAPGALGTFSYQITAPVGATNGTYRFNGDLVLSTTGEKIHPEGYYQDATIGTGTGGGAATLTGCSDSTSGLGCSGTASGGDTVVLTGTGIVCTPAFPAVTFGTSNAVVTSCGSTQVTTTTPAHAPGAVTVTLTNSGAAASNGLTYTYSDTTKPTYTDMSVAGDIVTVTFSEPVCRQAAWSANDWAINNVSNPNNQISDSGDTIPACNATPDNGVTSAQIITNTTVPPGSFVEVTILETTAGAGTNTSIRDMASSSNTIKAPQAHTATAGSPETTPPTLVAVSGAVGATEVTLTFSEPIYCDQTTSTWTYDANDISMTDNNTATTDPTFSGVGSVACPTQRANAATTFKVKLGGSGTLPADRTYTVTLTPEVNDIQDTANNDLANPAVATFTTGASDFTPPTIVDARMVNNLLTTDFTEAGDSFSATFSEAMNGTTTGTIQIQDQDGTVFTLTCGGNVSCTWNTAVTTVTVTIATTIVAPPVGSAGAGATPGMQIPFNITTLNGFADLQGNVPNVLGSPDRLVDYE